MALSVAGASRAADAAASGRTTVQELVVTAERRGAENIQNVPMAVDAYSGQSLAQMNVQSLQDLNKVDPSLQINAQGVGAEQVIIRGISSTTGVTTGSTWTGAASSAASTPICWATTHRC